METIKIRTEADLSNLLEIKEIFKRAGYLFVCSVTKGNETEMEFRLDTKY